MPKYFYWSTDGITFSPNAKFGGLILIQFGLNIEKMILLHCKIIDR